MDRRTLIFVVALTLALLGVNLFFQQRQEESLREWNALHNTEQVRKIQVLESEIAQNTVDASALPLVDIYADVGGTQFLTVGVQSQETLLTLRGPDPVPTTIFSRKQGSDQSLESYNITYTGAATGDPLVYQKGTEKSPLLIGELPDFGKLHLQLVTLPSGNQQQPVQITLGDYVDGHFSIPARQLEKLKIEVSQNKDPSRDDLRREAAPSQGNALALISTAKGYLPVALFQATKNKLVELESISGLHTTTEKPQLARSPTTSEVEEKFYVLESPYQQLVFSNYGGALAEINLPFTSKSDPQSVVREIEFDREMVEKHPYNAHFPSQAYYTPGEESSSNDTLIEHSEGTLGGYYPLIRRNLIESGSRKSVKINPRYYALNIVSEYPELAELVYEVKKFDKNSIVFEATQSNRRITKTFTFDTEKQAPYILNVAIKIEGESRGLWLTSGVPEVEWISGGPAPSLKYRITRNQKSSVENIDLPTDSLTVSTVYPDWISNSNGFLGIIQDPLSKIDLGYRVQLVPGTVVPSRLVEIEEDYDRFKAQDLPGYMTMLPLNANAGVMEFRVFAGPFSDSVLKAVDAAYNDPTTGYNPDYISCQSFHGWFAFISEPFAKFLFILMQFFHQITGSWALSIILLTVALRIMMYPLNAWSSKSMLRMQQIAPDVAAIQEKYKKDPKKAQIEVMNLYRERGVNPVSGCLPMLIQMPFLIGMFDLLKSTFDLRGASFIPGWIDDLTAPDVLFSWNTPIFFIGNQFHLLPILLGVVMFLQQRLMSPLPKDPQQLTDQQRQQKAMGSVMSVVFTLMFYNFPSGLNIYWLSSMLLGILQQWWTNKKMKIVPPVSTTQVKSTKRKA